MLHFIPVTSLTSDGMNLQRDEFGFVGSRVIKSKEQGITGWITRYDSKWDRYTIYIPKIGLEFYTRGEIIAMHAKFQIIKQKSDFQIEALHDTSSRYVGLCIVRRNSETKGVVKCFLPYENVYVVHFPDGKEEKMEEDEIIDNMIAMLKGKKDSNVSRSCPIKADKHVKHTKALTTKKRSIRFISGSNSPKSIQVADTKDKSKGIVTTSQAVDFETKQVRICRPENVATQTAHEESTEKPTETNATFRSIQPLSSRTIALGHLRQELLEFLKSYSDHSQCNALISILNNRDMKHIASIRRFTEETGLHVLNHALGACLHNKRGVLEIDRIYYLLKVRETLSFTPIFLIIRCKIIAMLPVPSPRVILDASIGRTIMLVAKSNVQEIPICVRELARWIKNKWLSRLSINKRTNGKIQLQCGRRTAPPSMPKHTLKVPGLELAGKKRAERDALKDLIRPTLESTMEPVPSQREERVRTEPPRIVNPSQGHARRIGTNAIVEVDAGERGVYGRNQRLCFSQKWAYCDFYKDTPPTSIRSTADTVHKKSSMGTNPAGIAKSILRRASKYEEELSIL